MPARKNAGQAGSASQISQPRSEGIVVSDWQEARLSHVDAGAGPPLILAVDGGTVAAATSGDRKLVRNALLTHPLVGQCPLVEQLERGIFETGAEHLAQFGGFRG
jgi:hypothetical protein